MDEGNQETCKIQGILKEVACIDNDLSTLGHD